MHVPILVAILAAEPLVHLDHDGVDLAWSVAGTGPVCIVPSQAEGRSCDLFRTTFGPLEQHFTMVYLDTRGTGSSDRTQPAEAHRWEDLVGDLDAVRAELGADHVWIAGHGSGGIQAMKYALTHPDRTAGLILISTGFGMTRDYQTDLGRRITALRDEPWAMDVITALVERGEGPPSTDEELGREHEVMRPAMFGDQEACRRSARYFDESPSINAFRNAETSGRNTPFDLRPALRSLDVPTIIVCGTRDIFASPYVAGELHRCIPGSKLVLVEHAGNYPWLEQPRATFAGIIQHADVVEADRAWRPLFNGRNLSGWAPKIAGHPLGEDPFETVRVEDGLLRIGYDRYEGEFNGRFLHLFHEEPFEEYDLRIEYRFHGDQSRGAPGWAFRNSGAMLHCQPPESMGVNQAFPVSIEGQFLGGDGANPRSTMNLCTPGTHVVMADRLEKAHCVNSNSSTQHGDQWVLAEFQVRNGHVRHLVDGELVMEYFDPQYDPDDADARAMITGEDRALNSGWISLQGESHPIDFRRVEIRPVSAQP